MNNDVGLVDRVLDVVFLLNELLHEVRQLREELAAARRPRQIWEGMTFASGPPEEWGCIVERLRVSLQGARMLSVNPLREDCGDVEGDG